MLRRKKSIAHTLYFILTLPFRILSWIFMHPLTPVVFTIFYYADIFRGSTFTSFSFSLPKENGLKDLIFYISLALYSIMVGLRIAHRFIRTSVLPMFVICGLTSIGAFWYLSTLMASVTISAFFGVSLFLIGLVCAGACVSSIFMYILSKDPGPLVSSPRVAFRNMKSGISGMLSWIRLHPIVVILVSLQLCVNIFLVARIAFVESRLGGSIFSTCNADVSIDKINKSVIRITAEEGQGTGMFIREDGIILTNAHVIANDPSPKVIFADYSFKTSKVLFRDDDKDIAVIKVEGAGYPEVTFEDPKIVPKRSQLYVHGYPLGTELRGDATTSKFSFVSVRSMKNVPTEMVQLDGIGTGGASGGPVFTSCGGVIGMFTSGKQGISFAISSKSIENAIDFLKLDQSQWPKSPEYPLEPDKSAVEAVRAFYTFLKMRDYKRAYMMQAPERVQSAPLSEWLKGYAKNIDFTVVSIIKAPIQPSPTPTPMTTALQNPTGILSAERVIVRIRTLDLEGQDVVVKYFEGPWIVVFDGEFWRLSQSNIQPVEKPGWDWFW